MVGQISILLCTMIRKLCYILCPEAIVKDDVAKASKHKSQEHIKSENHIAAKELVKQGDKNTKSTLNKKNEITLKGSCFLATRFDVNEMIASASDCYALVCEDALISLHDMQHSSPPAVSNILQEYSDVFPCEIPPGLPPIRGIEHQIDLISSTSLPNHVPYWTNLEETKEIQRQVQELLDKGYVRESLSPCAVLVILVPKKEGTWRMCVDCRAINNITVRYRHPIPHLYDRLDELSGATLFSNVDLRSAYHLIRMKLGDK
jgi:hypothetical protein